MKVPLNPHEHPIFRVGTGISTSLEPKRNLAKVASPVGFTTAATLGVVRPHKVSKSNILRWDMWDDWDDVEDLLNGLV